MRGSARVFGAMLLLASADRISWGCSVYLRPEVSLRQDLPPGAELRIRSVPTREFRIDLRDAAGRPVPAQVAAHLLPPKYSDRAQYTVIRPFARLSPGRYTLELVEPRPAMDGLKERWELAVVERAASTRPPAAVRNLRARAHLTQCPRGVEGCSDGYESCGQVALEFDDPGRRADAVYQVAWVPRAAGGPDRARERVVPGFAGEDSAGRTRIQIPVGWFDALQPTDTGVALEVRAIDDEGRIGPPADAALSAQDLRAVADARHRPKWHQPIERRYATDVERFRRAADPASAATLALLVGEVSPSGAAADRAFERVVLAKDGTFPLRGHLRGHEARTRVTLQVQVRGGRVYAPLSADELRPLVAALPLESGAIERVDLVYTDAEDSRIDIPLRGGDALADAWDADDPPDLRAKLRDRLAYWAKVEAIPLYRDLERHLGPPVTRSEGEVNFEGGGSQNWLTVRFPHLESPPPYGPVGPIELRGVVWQVRVASLAPLLDAALAERGIAEDPGSLQVELVVDGDAVSGRIYGAPGGMVTIAGRLGTDDRRPTGN